MASVGLKFRNPGNDNPRNYRMKICPTAFNSTCVCFFGDTIRPSLHFRDCIR